MIDGLHSSACYLHAIHGQWFRKYMPRILGLSFFLFGFWVNALH
nr:Uncharacterised protein [Klebsiella pneumoniae]